eukprot:scaffold21493_cov107-Isochrysis_galbana.AAC.4
MASDRSDSDGGTEANRGSLKKKLVKLKKPRLPSALGLSGASVRPERVYTTAARRTRWMTARPAFKADLPRCLEQ